MSSNKTDFLLGDGTRKHSQWRDVWARLRKNKLAMVCLAIIIILILVSILAPYITRYAYDAVNPSNKFQSPSWEHLLGTDKLGRDLLSRILYGGRISLLVSVLAVAISLVIGGLIGATAGFYGGAYDTIIMRVMDILMGIPSFLFAVLISAALGDGIINTAIAIAVTGIPSYARLVRASVLSIKGMEYIEAAEALGNSNMRTILKHVFPNILSPLIVQSTLNIGAFIMAISGLAFVNLGVRPPTPEWGSIMSDGFNDFLQHYHIVTYPGVFIVITLFAFNILGDGLRDAMDPKMKK